jgi:hypothetical protein
MINKFYFFVFFIVCGCGFSGTEKSKNELEFDSLANIIRPEVSFIKNMMNDDSLDPVQRDSALMIIDNVTELSYTEIKDKFDLKDSVSEREFLNALTVTTDLIAIKKEMEKILGN